MILLHDTDELNHIEEKSLTIAFEEQTTSLSNTLLSNKPIVNLSLPDINNPFVALMLPLFILADVIRHQQEAPVDITLFRQHLLQHSHSLATAFKKYDIGLSAFTTARYLMCCFLDEIILNTNWAKTHRWGFETLLSIFHGDTNGGEKFFWILKQLTQNSEKNRYLLELAFVCLKLGFYGKYVLSPRGAEQIMLIEDELYGEINQFTRQTKTLHHSSSNLTIKKSSIIPYLRWVSIVTIVILLCLVWSFLNMVIEKEVRHTLTNVTSTMEKHIVEKLSGVS